MPSPTHQWLQLWVARKMAGDGFSIVGYDGRTPQGGSWNALPRPFLVSGIRPDVWGLNRDTGEVAAGEAKTSLDISNAHTTLQLRVLSAVRDLRTGKHCRLYVAVPRSAARFLERVLAACGLARADHVVRLHIPDCIVEASADDRT